VRGGTGGKVGGGVEGGTGAIVGGAVGVTVVGMGLAGVGSPSVTSTT